MDNLRRTRAARWVEGEMVACLPKKSPIPGGRQVRAHVYLSLKKWHFRDTTAVSIWETVRRASRM